MQVYIRLAELRGGVNFDKVGVGRFTPVLFIIWQIDVHSVRYEHRTKTCVLRAGKKLVVLTDLRWVKIYIFKVNLRFGLEVNSESGRS